MQQLLGTIKDAYLPPFGLKELRGGQTFEYRHGSVATWAEPECGLAEKGCGGLLWQLREKKTTQRKQFGTSSIGEPAEITNAREALWQEVLQEAAQKFLASQGHGALFVVMRVVLPSEGNLGIADCENAVVGDGHAMRIASQIVQHMFWTAKRWFGVDDPFFSKQGAQECREGFFVGQREAFSVEGQLVSSKSASQSGHELPAKDTAENPHR